MSGDKGPSSASSSQQLAQLLASEIKGLPCFNPKDDPNTHCPFVGNAGSDLSIYIYGQRGSQWICKR